MKEKYQKLQQASFEETKFVIETMLEMYENEAMFQSEWPLYTWWLESAIRWLEKLEWNTEDELLMELWKLSNNLLFAYMAYKHFNME